MMKFKRKLLVTLVLPAIGLSTSAVLAAGDYGKQGAMSERHPATTAKEIHPQHTMQDVRASKLIGMNVRNAKGEDLGEINDLVVDVNNERVHYAVLGFGGALGLGEKLFAYPVTLFSQDTADKKLVLNVDKEKLKSAPGFERNNWPDWDKDRYRADVERYFGPTVHPRSMPNQSLARASQLIGKNVDDRNGRDAGEIEDLVVNLGNGKVHYAVLDFDKAWSADDKLLPLTLKSFQFPADRSKDLVLNVDRGQLDMSRGFAENAWPDIADPTYQRDIDGYLTRSRGVAGQPGPVMHK
jgi:sporulation protein YlmC with PRC-barrel domain